MSTIRPPHDLRAAYEAAAQEYLRSLPLEHFMEATAQATQRKITLESLDLVHAHRPDVHVFNELLVQYPGDGGIGGFRQVVPDNMVVIASEPPEAETSFNVELETARPLWVMEYVSRSNKRKDYEESFDKYERDLKVPYYLLFYPDDQELTLYHRGARKYVSVKPNEHGRLAIPELDLEMGVLDGWVRYWYRGELLPLPAELQRDLDEARRQLAQQKRQARNEKRRADRLEQKNQELQHRADEQARQAEAERQARQAVEEELVRLRAQIEQQRQRPNHRP